MGAGAPASGRAARNSYRVRYRRLTPRRFSAALLAVLAVTFPLTVLTSTPAQATTVKLRLRAAIENFTPALETLVGYQRSKFQLWIDANGDCQDTRAEVLITESTTATTGDCTIKTGKWFSYYDRRTWRRASDVDIDHLVPLKEAWDSGAKKWNADTRKRYANDLKDSRTLVAVTDNVNQSKGDRDPADWLPQYGKCRCVGQWVAVKLRWSLKVTSPRRPSSPTSPPAART